jgi:hypothetical protein
MLLIIFFFFSAISQHIFGGKYNSGWEKDLGNVSIYLTNNFNDTYSSIINLFTLLIVNDWMV